MPWHAENPPVTGFLQRRKALIFKGIGEAPQQAAGPRGRTGALLARLANLHDHFVIVPTYIKPLHALPIT